MYIYIYIQIYHIVYSTMCHRCRFHYQQRVLKTFPGPGYLRPGDVDVCFNRNFCEMKFLQFQNMAKFWESIFAVCKKPVYFNLTSINDTRFIFIVEHYSFTLKSHIRSIVYTLRTV